MQKTLDFVKELAEQGNSVNEIISKLSGWMWSEASHDTKKTYSVEEVAELFNLLHDIRVDQIATMPKDNIYRVL